MTGNLKMADAVVRLAGALLGIGLYLAGAISGPLATFIVVLSSFILLTFLGRIVFNWIFMD